MPDRARHRQALCVLAIIALAAPFVSGGCYKRVVAAEGIGADQMDVQAPNRSNTALDKAIFGSDTKSNKRRPEGYRPHD